jgi:hypothetical protein
MARSVGCLKVIEVAYEIREKMPLAHTVEHLT